MEKDCMWMVCQKTSSHSCYRQAQILIGDSESPLLASPTPCSALQCCPHTCVMPTSKPSSEDGRYTMTLFDLLKMITVILHHLDSQISVYYADLPDVHVEPQPSSCPPFHPCHPLQARHCCHQQTPTPDT